MKLPQNAKGPINPTKYERKAENIKPVKPPHTNLMIKQNKNGYQHQIPSLIQVAFRYVEIESKVQNKLEEIWLNHISIPAVYRSPAPIPWIVLPTKPNTKNNGLKIS